jgi:hypothetical protein
MESFGMNTKKSKFVIMFKFHTDPKENTVLMIKDEWNLILIYCYAIFT